MNTHCRKVNTFFVGHINFTEGFLCDYLCGTYIADKVNRNGYKCV